jgi:hypothetical protein
MKISNFNHGSIPYKQHSLCFFPPTAMLCFSPLEEGDGGYNSPCHKKKKKNKKKTRKQEEGGVRYYYL